MGKVFVERELRKILFKRVLSIEDLDIKKSELLEYLKLDFRSYLKEMGLRGYDKLISLKYSADKFQTQYNSLEENGLFDSSSRELLNSYNKVSDTWKALTIKIDAIEGLWSSVNSTELYIKKIPDISKIDKIKVNNVMKEFNELNKNSFRGILVEIELEDQIIGMHMGKKTTMAFNSETGTYSNVFNIVLKLLDKNRYIIGEMVYNYVLGNYPKLYKVCNLCVHCKKSKSLKESAYFESKKSDKIYMVDKALKIESSRFIDLGLDKKDYYEKLSDYSYLVSGLRENSNCPCNNLDNNLDYASAKSSTGFYFDDIFKMSIYAIDKYLNRKILYKEKRKNTKVLTKAHVPSDVYIQNDFIDNDKLDLKFLNLRDYAIYEKRGYEYKGGHHSSPVEHIRRGHWRKYKSGKKVWIDTTEVNKGKGKKVYLVN